MYERYSIRSDSVLHLILVQLSRRQHPGVVEEAYPCALKLAREYLGPYALQQVHEEMKMSLSYECKAMQKPVGHATWVSIPWWDVC